MGILGNVINLRAASSWLYFKPEGAVQSLMHELKYQENKKLGIWLGREFGKQLASSPFSEKLDIIIPVPLHKKKERIRGYNQSTLLAKGLSASLNIPFNVEALVRTRHTDSQTKKSREERVNNIEGAFSVKSPQELVNKNILLVDDVVTTGSTIIECAKTLEKANPQSISVCTLGIALEI